jgi:GNAT superfamily N-acetyltransferase
MVQPKLILVEHPGPEHRDEIFRLLVDYNTSKIGPAVVEALAIILQCPESDAIIGGLWGESYYDWLFINFLIVPDKFRKRGVGSALMKRAEEIAANRGCLGIRLDTFSFQAPGFYEKLGYRIFGRLVNHPKGYERIYYFKELPDSDRR